MKRKHLARGIVLFLPYIALAIFTFLLIVLVGLFGVFRRKFDFRLDVLLDVLHNYKKAILI